METTNEPEPPIVIEKICRSCMNESDEMQSLFTAMDMAGLQTQVSDMLMACASVKIESNDGLPGLICQLCVHQLSNAYSFKQQCETTDTKLREYVNLPPLTTEPRRTIKEETESLNIIVKPDIDMGVMTEMFDNDNYSDNESSDSDSIKQTRKSSKKCTHRCSQCLSKFASKAGLKQHMRKHEKEKQKNYSCSVCNASFPKSSDLKKHKTEHKSESNDVFSDIKPEYNDERSDLSETNDRSDDPDFTTERIGAKTRSSTRKRDAEVYECNHCHKILSTFNGLRIHKRRHTGQNLAQCYLCTKSFTKTSHLKRHLLSHGIDNSMLHQVKSEPKSKMTLQCEFCDRKFVYRKSFTHHMRTEHAISDSDDITSFDLNVKTEESKDETADNNGDIPDIDPEEPGEITNPTNEDEGQEFECHVCNHKFTRANHLTRHMTLHRNVLIHKCDRCEKAYLTSEHLQKHVQEYHIDRPYVCTVCDKPFARGEHLIRHLKTHDNTENPDVTSLKCSVCEKVFNSSENLARHTKQHLLKDKRHVCEVCNKAFNRLDNLRTHQRVHSGVKDPVRLHLCIYCGKEFNNSSNMIVHMRRHTGERPYKCTECGKGFPRSHDLKCHERTHSGERPYLCTLCGKSFNKSNKLVRHTRVHTGERPYVCNLCGRAFTQSNDLALHMRRHTGSRPYACGICPARFIQSGQLKAHRRSQGHWVEQEIHQFRGNRVEPVHIEGLVETPIKHRKRANTSNNVPVTPNFVKDFNTPQQQQQQQQQQPQQQQHQQQQPRQQPSMESQMMPNVTDSSMFPMHPIAISTNGLTITPLRESNSENQPLANERETFQPSTSSTFTPPPNVLTTSTSYGTNDNYNFQQFG